MALFSFKIVLFITNLFKEKMKEDQNIDREVLFFRYCTGKITVEEKRRVEEMIHSSVQALEELKVVQEAVNIRKKIIEIESCDISSGLQAVRNILKKRSGRKRFLSMLSQTAAILAIPLLISTLIMSYLAFHKTSDEVTYAEVVSAPGVISRFELPDKSKVWLNSKSTLRYPTRFDGSAAREVELKGEGYFEVQSDKEHPFYVKTTSGIEVMAYGTKFNVNSEQKTVETVLAEGKVALFRFGHKLDDLNPGEQASFDNETCQLNMKEVNLYEKLAWKDGKIVFRNAPLSEVFKQLSKRYNVDIVLHNEKHLSESYLSRVTFTDETIQQIFYYLEIAAPLKWKLSIPEQNNDSTLTKQRIDVWLKNK